MSKPHWTYQPLMDGGISVANQEATARATETERKDDTVFQRDYAALVEALRRQVMNAPLDEQVIRIRRELRPFEMDEPADTSDWTWFASQWGFPALLRALARAIELETK